MRVRTSLFLLFAFVLIASTIGNSFTRADMVSLQILAKFPGMEASADHGLSLAFTGDVDGDGAPDIIAGAPGASPEGRSEAGSVSLYSGKTHALLHTFHGENLGDNFGISVASPGDLNNDGAADILVGANNADPGNRTDAGRVYLFSGANFSQLGHLDGEMPSDEFGASIASIGDLDGNNRPEFAVGAPQASSDTPMVQAGVVYVYNDNLVLLRKLAGQTDQDSFGISIAGAGDTNGDRITDIIVGADLANPDGRVNAGSAYVYSGADFALLTSLHGEAAGDFFGASVAGLGDVDRDGSPDIIVGAPAADPFGRIDAGSAYVFSGANYTTLHRFDGQSAGDDFGSSVSTAGDQNRDLTPDFLVGSDLADASGMFDAGTVFIYDGRDYLLMGQIDGEGQGDNMGFSLGGGVDTDADGRPDLLVGAPFSSPGGLVEAGSAYLYKVVNLPEARFTFNPTTPLVSQRVKFDASLSTDPDGTILSYSWRFGDGTNGTGVETVHAYSSRGNFTITLTVFDDGGNTSTETRTVHVNEQPLAIVSATTLTPKVGQSVTFDAASSSDSDGTINSYSWDFGDGTSAAGITVRHTYTTPGNYTVTLTLMDNLGGKSGAQKTVNVNAGSPPRGFLEQYLVYAVIAAGLLGLGWIWLRRKRRRVFTLDTNSR